MKVQTEVVEAEINTITEEIQEIEGKAGGIRSIPTRKENKENQAEDKKIGIAGSKTGT